jgi:hypothetical protein
MKPTELLEEVKLRFTTLLHNEPPRLEALLRQALGVYQEKAGCVRKVKIRSLTIDVDGESTFAMPNDFLAMQVLKDARSGLVRHDVNTSEKTITLHYRDRGAKLPLDMHYFVNLRRVPLNEYELPEDIVSLVQDYLEALIRIPNTARERLVLIAGNMDPTVLPSDSELIERKEALELEMQSNRVITPMITID